jgi:hypothetical protein
MEIFGVFSKVFRGRRDYIKENEYKSKLRNNPIVMPLILFSGFTITKQYRFSIPLFYEVGGRPICSLVENNPPSNLQLKEHEQLAFSVAYLSKSMGNFPWCKSGISRFKCKVSIGVSVGNFAIELTTHNPDEVRPAFRIAYFLNETDTAKCEVAYL